MASVKTYTVIFGVLMVISTVQFVFEISGLLSEYYAPIMAVIMVLSTAKAVVVAGWYMHMLEEPRAITYITMGGVFCVIALAAGAMYSMT